MFSWFQSQFLCWYKIKPFLIIISPFNSPFHLTVPTNPSHMLVKSPPFPTSCVPFPRFSHFPSSSPQICPDPKLPVAILFYLTCQLIAFSFLQSTQLIKSLVWQPPLLSNCFTSWFLHLPLISPLSHSHSFPSHTPAGSLSLPRWSPPPFLMSVVLSLAPSTAPAGPSSQSRRPSLRPAGGAAYKFQCVTAFLTSMWHPVTPFVAACDALWRDPRPQVAVRPLLLLLLSRWRTSKPELEIKGAASNAIHGGWREGGGGLDGRDIGRCQCLIRSVGAKCCCIFIH